MHVVLMEVHMDEIQLKIYQNMESTQNINKKNLLFLQINVEVIAKWFRGSNRQTNNFFWLGRSPIYRLVKFSSSSNLEENFSFVTVQQEGLLVGNCEIDLLLNGGSASRWV